MDPIKSASEVVDIGARVFVANSAGHDYAEAEQYGELRSITLGFISFQSLDRVKFTVAEAIVDTRPDDWLLLSGTNIVNVFAAILWYEKHGVVKILNFDKTTRKYRDITMTRDNVGKLLELLEGERK